MANKGCEHEEVAAATGSVVDVDEIFLAARPAVETARVARRAGQCYVALRRSVFCSSRHAFVHRDMGAAHRDESRPKTPGLWQVVGASSACGWW